MQNDLDQIGPHVRDCGSVLVFPLPLAALPSADKNGLRTQRLHGLRQFSHDPAHISPFPKRTSGFTVLKRGEENGCLVRVSGPLWRCTVEP